MKKRAFAYLLCLSTLILCACGADVAPGRGVGEDTRSQDGIGERELLVVSFGTSYNDARQASIGAIEDAMETAFPEWSVRRAFTSQIVLDHVRERDGVSMDNVTDALDRAAANGVKTLVVQPTHIMSGYEYNDVLTEVAAYAGVFDKLSVGEPLLTGDDDFSRVADAVVTATAEYDDGETAVCLMGHGTEASSNGVYGKLQTFLPAHYYVGTVEASPSLEDVLSTVRAGSYRRVVLFPLMIVAGDHANNDMAGDGDDSWKSAFASAGYEVTCVLRGLGELEAIQTLFAEHAQAAMDAPTLSRTPDAPEKTELRPVYAADLNEGVYALTVDSSSSMFRVTDCALSVSDGGMSAVMTMGGTGYLYVYPGSASEAADAPESAYVPYVENADGAHTFAFPVAALNVELPCAAYSKSREQWYDRTLRFRADSLPPYAFASLPDGDYTVEVTLDGGSGRASVSSPAPLTVRDGVCTVVITWSSPNYDYMTLDGKRYLPVNADGNSTFELPVAAFDSPVTVCADTLAMSHPHEIEYALTFHSATVRAV